MMATKKETRSASRELAARVRRIRCVLMDVDGVLTDGKIHFTSNGEEFKTFDIQDGHGIAMAKRVGLKIGFVSGRPSVATTKRAADLGVDIVMQQASNKMDMVEQIKRTHGLSNEEICFIGDELVDLPVLTRVGLAVAVANAVPEVKAAAHLVTKQSGGNGAVRETLELIMKRQNTWSSVIAKYLVVLAVMAAGAGAALSRANESGATPSEPRTTGMIEKFEVPELDEHGALKWKMYGDKARLRSDGLMDIYNMRAEFYSSNRLDLVFTTPECLLDRARKRATTEAPVRIERPGMVLTGNGGAWDGATSSFLVRSNVTVQLRDGSSGWPELKPATQNKDTNR